MATKNIQDTLYTELIDRQLDDIPVHKKLQCTDIRRLCKYIDGNIFEEDGCCLWNGYITNSNNPNRGIYVNFYFKKRKVALHRLLYCNYIGPLNDDEYIKFVCKEKGKCCNIHHFKKFKYDKPQKEECCLGEKKIHKKKKKEVDFTIRFD